MQSLGVPDLPPERFRSTQPATIEGDDRLARLARKACSNLQRDGYYLVRGSGCWWEPCLGRWLHFDRHWSDLKGAASRPETRQAVRRLSLWCRSDITPNANPAPDASGEPAARTLADTFDVVAGEAVADPCFRRLAAFCATVLQRGQPAHAQAIETSMVRLQENRDGLVSCALTSLIGGGGAQAAIALIAKRNIILSSIHIRLSRPGCVREALLLHPQDVILLDLSRIAVGPLSWMCVDGPHPAIADFLIVRPSDFRIASPLNGPVWLS
jgi:hypothetical protein